MAFSSRQLFIVLLAVGFGANLRSLRLPAPAFVPVEHVPPEAVPHPRPLGQGAFAGFTAASTQLRDHAKALFADSIHGSETVAISPSDGSLWMLDKWGQVHRAALGGGSAAEESSAAMNGSATEAIPKWVNPQLVAYVGPGRPLGTAFDAEGRLLICNCLQGLQRLDPTTGSLETLASRVSDDSPLAPGSLISFANNLDVASNGDVIFSDSTDIPPALNGHPSEGGWYDAMHTSVIQMLRGRPTGRLLRWSAANGKTHVLVEGLWFANGVVLSQDESFALVAETFGMRVHKVPLQGEQTGTKEVFLDRLPGFPDNMIRASDGGFWLDLVGPDSPAARAAIPYRLARWVLAWAPKRMLPIPPAWGCVVKLSPQGQVQAVLLDPPGPDNRVRDVTLAVEHDGRLYMGNLVGSGVTVVRLADVELH